MRYAISIEGTGGDLVKGVLQIDVDTMARRAAVRAILDRAREDIRRELGAIPSPAKCSLCGIGRRNHNADPTRGHLFMGQ